MTNEEFQDESMRLMHAIQTGVLMTLNLDEPTTSEREKRFRKHLRVGINNALIEGGAIARLLIEKGIVSSEEYNDALIAGLKREVAQYEADLNARVGGTQKITLA